MEINQLIQSTTMEYDMQLTKFTDHVKQHRQKLWKGQQTANNDTEDVSATKALTKTIGKTLMQRLQTTKLVVKQTPMRHMLLRAMRMLYYIPMI